MHRRARSPTVSGNLVSLVPEAGPGASITYSFTAAAAGTYLYESGSDPQLQVQMGLFGALIIRPANITITAQDILDIPFEDGALPTETNGANSVANMSPAEAAAIAMLTRHVPTPTSTGRCTPTARRSAIELSIYDGTVGDGSNGTTAGEVRGENLLLLSEVDPGLHNFMEQHVGTPSMLNWHSYPNGYEAHYFMINGRSMPDTVAPNNAPWMPSQPYGAMAHVQPWDVHNNALDVMLRYIAVGPAPYDFHPHSNHEHVIAADGRADEGVSQRPRQHRGQVQPARRLRCHTRRHLPVDERRGLQRHRHATVFPSPGRTA